jgi:DNA-binding NarL/FixJ family response regulator
MSYSSVGASDTDAPVVAVPARHRILIADDHPLIVAGIRSALSHAEDIEIVGEAHSGPAVMAMIERRRPTLVLLDYRMPGVQGTDCIEEIGQRWPEVKTVVVSACEDRAQIDAALDAGAIAYVIKSVSGFDIASVVRQTSNGAVFHGSSRSRIQERQGGSARERAGGLTERELSILGAIAAGSTTAEISRQFWVSEHTVKFHLTNIYRKLGVRNRAGAIRYALDKGLVGA